MTIDTTPRTIDLEAALAKLSGDQALVSELAELFCDESPKLISALRAGVATRDAKAIRAAAHSLKGSLNIFCAKGAATLAARLEDCAAAEQLPAADELFAELEVELEKVRAALNDFNTSKSAYQNSDLPKVT